MEHWATKLGFHIHGCENCQPYEDEIVWLDNHMSLAGFLEENGAPKDLHQFIAEQLCCACGSELDLSTEIVVDSYEVQLDEIAGDRFGDWVIEDDPRLHGFINVLQDSPSSAINHEIGIQILKQLGELPRCEVAGKWWRAQSLPKSKCPPSITRLGPRPQPSSHGGRFNSPGQRAFYLAAERDSAVAETRKYQKLGEEIWVLQYRIDNIDNIVNLTAPTVRTNAFCNLSLPMLFAGLLWCDGLVHQNGNAIERTYMLAQFIANSAISLGIRGFKINSQLHSGTNLVLFSWGNQIVKPVGTPEFAKTPPPPIQGGC